MRVFDYSVTLIMYHHQRGQCSYDKKNPITMVSFNVIGKFDLNGNVNRGSYIKLHIRLIQTIINSSE